jgi:hypothetical protein
VVFLPFSSVPCVVGGASASTGFSMVACDMNVPFWIVLGSRSA